MLYGGTQTQRVGLTGTQILADSEGRFVGLGTRAVGEHFLAGKRHHLPRRFLHNHAFTDYCLLALQLQRDFLLISISRSLLPQPCC